MPGIAARTICGSRSERDVLRGGLAAQGHPGTGQVNLGAPARVGADLGVLVEIQLPRVHDLPAREGANTGTCSHAQLKEQLLPRQHMKQPAEHPLNTSAFQRASSSPLSIPKRGEAMLCFCLPPAQCPLAGQGGMMNACGVCWAHQHELERQRQRSEHPLPSSPLLTSSIH